MKSIFKKNKHNPFSLTLEDAMNWVSKKQYADCYAQCKAMKKSSDPIERAKGKHLERSYRVFQNNGVPFAVAQIIYPQLCRIYGDYNFEYAKLIEAAGKSNEQP